MEIINLIHNLIAGKKPSNKELERAMQIISRGGATPSQISAFFTAMLMNKSSKENIAKLIRYIENKNLINNKIFHTDSIYIYSSDVFPFTFLLAIILSELNNETVVRFKSNIPDQNHITKTLKMNLDINIDLELKMLENYKVSFSKNSYEPLLKNLIFLNRELKFTGLIETLESLISPKNYNKKIIILKEGELLLDVLNTVQDNELFIIIYSEKKQKLEITNRSKTIFNAQLNYPEIFNDISCINKLNNNKIISHLLTDIINATTIYNKKISDTLNSTTIYNKLEQIIKLSNNLLK